MIIFCKKKSWKCAIKVCQVVENSANEELDLIISDFYLEEEYQVPVFIRSFPSTDNDWELLSNLVSKIKLNLKGVI